MTDLLKQAIDSGQVSAAQIEAHRAADELPIEMYEPKFLHTYCAQCDKDLGPGWDGVLSCDRHAPISPTADLPMPTMEDVASGKVKHIFQGRCPDITNDFKGRDSDCPVCLFLKKL